MIASGTVGFVIFCVFGAGDGPKAGGPTCGANGFTSVDHKRIGVMYILMALLMLVRGFSDAMLMRSQLALARRSRNRGILPPEHTIRSSPRTAQS